VSVLDEIDALAAAGKINSVTLWRRKDGWQANVQSADTGGWTCLTRDTPSEGLAAVLALKPVCDKYDRDNRLAKPVEPYDDEMLAPPAVDEPPLSDLMETEEAGVFD